MPERMVDEADEADVEEIGRVAAELLCSGPAWVHRGKERVSFVDDIVVRRQESVDFEVPPDLPHTGERGGEQVIHLPVMVLRKAPRAFLDFDFKDSAGHAVPLPARRRNGAISAAALRSRAEAVIAAQLPGETLDKTLADRLERIARDDPPGNLEELREILVRNPDLVGTEQRPTLANDPGFQFLCRLLAWGSIVAMPVPNEPGAPHLLKLVYSEPINQFRSGFTTEVQLGWAPVQSVLDLPFIGGGTYHLEVHPPDGLEIVGGRLVYRGQSGVHKVEAQQSGRALHLYVPDARKQYNGAAQFFARAPSDTFVGGAFRAAIVVAVVLTLFLLFADPLSRNDKSAATLLLLLPGIIATYIFRPGEHLMTSRLLRWSRRALIASAGCAFLAAGWLVVSPDDETTGRRITTLRTTRAAAAPPSVTEVTTRTTVRTTPRGDGRRPARRTTRERTEVRRRSRISPPKAETTRLNAPADPHPAASTLRIGWGILAVFAWAMVWVLGRSRKARATPGGA